MAVMLSSVRGALRRARTAAWLGWQVEGNWADPVLFAIYVLARPLATSLILAVMYRTVAGHGADPAVFTGFFVANAFHASARSAPAATKFRRTVTARVTKPCATAPPSTSVPTGTTTSA